MATGTGSVALLESSSKCTLYNVLYWPPVILVILDLLCLFPHCQWAAQNDHLFLLPPTCLSYLSRSFSSFVFPFLPHAWASSTLFLSRSIISLGPAPSHYRRVHLQPHTWLQCIRIVFLLAEAEMVICGLRGKLRVGTTSCLTTAYGSFQFCVLPLCSYSGSQPGNVTDLFAFGPAGVCQKTVPVHSSPKTTCFFLLI